MAKPKPAPVTPPPGDVLTPLSDRLLDLVTAAGVSQRELARRSGVDAGDISRYLGGKMTNMALETARKLAGALSVPVDRLIGDAAPTDAPVPTGLQMLTLHQLATSPLNPRKAFDADAIAELAESIAAHGVLQNLVVRPGPTPVHPFEIVAGERRYRALAALEAAGRWPVDRGIPCRVIAADEPTARAVALLENLQRVDISPLEEAAAFAALHKLDAKRWSTAAIAGTIHRTQRYVQQRLALTRLDDRVQAALTTGQITVEAARALAPADPAKQRALLPRMIESPYYQRPEWIREKLTGRGYDAALAIFPLDAYDGARLETDDGKTWLLDRDQFDRLQKVAAEAKVAALAKKWKWARLVEPPEYEGDYADERTTDRTVGGALVVVRWNGVVEIQEGLVEEAAEPKDAAAGPDDRIDRWEQERAAREVEARARQDGIERADRALVAALCEAPLADLLSALLLSDLDMNDGGHVPDDARDIIGLPRDDSDLDRDEHDRAWAAAVERLLNLDLDATIRLAAACITTGFTYDRAGPGYRALLQRYDIPLPPHLQPEADVGEDAEAEAPIEDVETVEG